MNRWRRTRALLVGAALLGAGCVAGAQRVGAVDASAADDALVRPDAPLAPPGSLEAFCRGQGGGDLPDGRCAGALAEVTFRYALCVCGAWDGSATLSTDSFDSAAGSYRPGGRGGAVGVNGDFTSVAAVQLGGALRVAGARGVEAPAGLTVLGELWSAALVRSDAAVAVGDDAWVGGDVRAQDLSVGGTLTVPAGRVIAVTRVRNVAREARAPVAVPPPCDCDGAPRIDVAAVVAARRGASDDAALGVDPRRFADVRTDETVTLPCGRIYLAGVGGSASLTLALAGRTALYVDGDVALGGALRIELGPAAELDLFVAGNLSTGGALTLGSPARPAAARLYVGGTGALAVSGAGVLAGNVYAPRAQLALAADAEVYGAVVAGSVAASSAVRVHYDTAVLRAGASCPRPPDGPPCASCRDCGNQACVAGRCGQCTDDAQCCAPLTCYRGRCEAEVP